MIDDMTLMKKMIMFMKRSHIRMGGHGMPGMGPGRGMPPAGICPGGPHGGRPHGRTDGCDHGRRPPLSREHLLTLISQYPDGVRQKVIAEKAGISQSSASEVINKLENDGYVERKVDPDDKRATLLFLTEMGTARAAEVEDERKEMLQGMFYRLTEEEKQTLSELLDKLLTEDLVEA